MMAVGLATGELTGAPLDYWTGRAEGILAAELTIQLVPRTTNMICIRRGTQIYNSQRYDPSTNWALGGPLLDRLVAAGHGITPNVFNLTEVDCSTNDCEGIPFDRNWDKPDITTTGANVLTAVCRALVTSVYGDTVPCEVPQ